MNRAIEFGRVRLEETAYKTDLRLYCRIPLIPRESRVEVVISRSAEIIYPISLEHDTELLPSNPSADSVKRGANVTGKRSVIFYSYSYLEEPKATRSKRIMNRELP